MHIARIDIDELPPLYGNVFDFDERINLFIGSNASGKSAILRAITAVHSLALGEVPPPTKYGEAVRVTNVPPEEADVGTLYLNHDFLNEDRPIVIMETSRDWPRDASGAKWNAAPFLYIPATRISLPGPHVFGQSIEELEYTIPPDVTKALSDTVKRLSDTESGVFDGRLVKLAMHLHARIMPFLKPQHVQFRKAVLVGYSCASRICLEVVADFAPHPYVGVNEDGAFTEMHHYMGIGTNDHTSDPLYVGALSSGTQGTLLWVWALAIKMAHHYGWTEGWEKKPAILLIDEIENHLHPTWQRRVIPTLLEHFPGLQIFATTHSPFVVAGLKAGQVHLLKRDENGFVKETTNTEDVIGWTADEILRNMMGVEDPTDNETAEAARELRQLRNEEPRSDPEEEEARQRRIQELRQLVDRDLLAGGPWKKQRELFEQQFAEALQKYQQSQGLNQENG